jgi:acetyl esterase/lipase
MPFSPRSGSIAAAFACLALFLAGPLRAQERKAIENIEFAKVGDRSLQLDLYVPAGAVKPPLVVYVHGGGWRAGKRDNIPLGKLVWRGFAVASIDYRLSTEATFPAQAFDIKGAIRFLRAHAKEYGVDASRIAIAGSSAGGHLAALTGVTNGVKELEGTVGGNLQASSDVQAIMDFFGASDLESIMEQSTPTAQAMRGPALQLLLGGSPAEKPALAKLASPVTHVGAGDPPLLIIHGDADPQMPYEQAQELQRAYEKAGLSVQFVTIPGGKHGGPEFYDETRTDLMAAFLTKAMGAPAPKAKNEPKPAFADVSYGPDPHQLLDVFVPPDTTGPAPVLIWYGGLWEPSKHVPDLHRFLPAHIAVVGVQLRTMKDAQRDQVSPPIAYIMQDATRAVQYVRLHAAEWHLDPRRIAVGGGSQGTLPALYVGCAGERAKPDSADPVERQSTAVVCVAAYRSQPSIDPKQMQEWVPGVQWGAPALGYAFDESLKRREELLPIIRQYSPDALLHKGTAPIYFENEWGLTQPENVTEGNYKVHSPAWAAGFQKLAEKAGVTCYAKWPGHPTEGYNDIWDFIVKSLQAPVK